jgi:hypothetical protein
VISTIGSRRIIVKNVGGWHGRVRPRNVDNDGVSPMMMDVMANENR